MGILKMDERRRITLPKELVGEEDREFVAVRRQDEIVLIFLPKNPLAALAEFGKSLKGATVGQLRKEVYEAALEEVG